MKIDGRKISQTILQDLKIRVNKLKSQGVTPQMYIILLSDDPNSSSYVKQKLLRGEEVGVKITLDKENTNITTEKLTEKIEKLNIDSSIHGIIVQRPMPKQLDEEIIANTVVPTKDIDGFNKNSKFDIPVTMAVFKFLQNVHAENFENWLNLQKIAILGYGLTAGKPIADAFEKNGISPTVITSKTGNKTEVLKNADIIISAVGKANIVKANEIKDGAVLIGIGLHGEKDGKFHGDYREEEIQNSTSFYSPTPGGVGPVNVAYLMSNLIKAAENSLDKSNSN